MPLEKHDLLHEFPEAKATIHALKLNNSHFSRLFDEYHEVTHHVRRIETGAENTSDEFLETKKKERLKLKDALYEMIQSHPQQA